MLTVHVASIYLYREEIKKRYNENNKPATAEQPNGIRYPSQPNSTQHPSSRVDPSEWHSSTEGHFELGEAFSAFTRHIKNANEIIP
jgi:hypothetical protein